jgi:hypothetical protein
LLPVRFLRPTHRNNILANELKIKGSGSSPQYTAGTHHLEINSECDWTITATDG